MQKASSAEGRIPEESLCEMARERSIRNLLQHSDLYQQYNIEKLVREGGRSEIGRSDKVLALVYDKVPCNV